MNQATQKDLDWADYGIRVNEQTFAVLNDQGAVVGSRDAGMSECPRCQQYRLHLSAKAKSWHCDGCYWSGRLRGGADVGAGMVDLAESASMLERWHAGGLPPALSCGIKAIDDQYKPRRGEVSVVTGYPGDGKSTFLKWYLSRVSMIHNVRFAVFSPEDQPFHLFLGQMVMKVAGKPFGLLERRELRMATQWVSNRFSMVDPPEATAEAILAQVRLNAGRGFQGVVIDPWTEVEHNMPPGMREDQYLNKVLGKVRRLARFLHVHVWIVVHPRNIDRVQDGSGKKKQPVPTMDDLAGGAMWKNKPDWGLTVHRPYKGKEGDDQVDLHVQKARFSGFLGGFIGAESLTYNSLTGTYSSDKEAFGSEVFPLDAWKEQLNTYSTMMGYFDNPDWVWPMKDPTRLRPIDWVAQKDGGWWHEVGKFQAYVDPSDFGWKVMVRLKSDATSRRTAGPFQKPDEAFSWAERTLMDWDYMADPRSFADGQS